MTSAEVIDKQIKTSDDFVWPIEVPLTGKFIIDVEFLDLKTAAPNVPFLISSSFHLLLC